MLRHAEGLWFFKGQRRCEGAHARRATALRACRHESPAHDLNTEAYRRLSPFEQILSIDDDGLVQSESGVILIYLAKKSGRLIPGNRAGEAQVVGRCFAAMNSVEPPLLSLLALNWTADRSCGKARSQWMAA